MHIVRYGMPRLAIYTELLGRVNASRDSKVPHRLTLTQTSPQPQPKAPLPFSVKLLLGSVAGGSAAFIGTPSEVALVRMSTDSKLPPAQRRGYSNVLSAIATITKEEGLGALWSGAGPTIGRAVILNACQLGCYSEIKERLVGMGMSKDGIPTMFVSAMCCSFIAQSAAMPADVVSAASV